MFIGIAQRTAASSLTFNQQRALNAAGCAVDNLGVNFWHFIAAIYYLMRQFGQEKLVEDKINEYYPYVCTCNKEMDEVAALTSVVTAATSVIFAACSEQA